MRLIYSNVPIKRGCRFLLLLAAVFAFTVRAAAQIPIIRIDPHSRFAQQNAPFDRSFFLLLPVDTTLEMDDIGQLTLSKVTGRGKNLHFETLRIYLGDQIKKIQFIDTPKVPRFKYLEVLIDEQLLPNTRFSVLLVLKAAHDYLDSLNKINQEIHDGDLAAAEADYDKLRTGQTVKYSSTPIAWPPFSLYSDYYDKKLAPVYDQVVADDPALVTQVWSIGETMRKYGFKIDQLFTSNCCGKDLAVSKLYTDSTKFLIPLFNLLRLADSTNIYFASGELNIQEFELHELVKPQEIQKRIDNLQRLEVGIRNIAYFFHLSSFASNIVPAMQQAIYNSTQVALKGLDARIKQLSQTAKDIRGGINGMADIASAEASFGGSLPMGQDLKTASGNYFIGDFGLANAGTIVNNQFAYTLRPYIGVNISFVAIDKTQPLNSIQHKRFAHHLSFVMGLTTSALTRQGTYDLIKNMSVVTGIAYRLSRSFRMTGGVLVYERDNPNPELPARPTVGPMLALSLDLEVSKWFGDLFKIF